MKEKMGFLSSVSMLLALVAICILFLSYENETITKVSASHSLNRRGDIVHSFVDYGDEEEDEAEVRKKEIYELIAAEEGKKGKDPTKYNYRIDNKSVIVERVAKKDGVDSTAIPRADGVDSSNPPADGVDSANPPAGGEAIINASKESPLQHIPRHTERKPPSSDDFFRVNNSTRWWEQKITLPATRERSLGKKTSEAGSPPIKYFEPIRVVMFLEDLVSSSLKEEDERIMKFFVGDVFPAALEYLSSVVKVQRGAKSYTKFKRFCKTEWIEDHLQHRACAEIEHEDMQTCLHSQIPADHLEEVYLCEEAPEDSFEKCKLLKAGKGIKNADLVLYVQSKQSESCNDSGTLGYAGFCMMDQVDRPIAGYFNICLSSLKGTKSFYWRKAVFFVLHEIFHALGFSRTAFPFFRQSNLRFNYLSAPHTSRLEPLTPRGKNGMPAMSDDTFIPSTRTTLYNVREPNGKKNHFLVTKSAQRLAREYFDCNSAKGIPLENQDNLETVPGDHLESKTFNEDFMTSSLGSYPIVSKISLSVLDDSGWYRVNYDRAGEPLWGRGTLVEDGCKFLEENCLSGDKANPTPIDKSHFCAPKANEKIHGCTQNLKAFAICRTYEYESTLPKQFQYFLDPKIGGSSHFMDFCPHFESFRIIGHDGGTDCTNEENSLDHSALGAEFGQNSRCVESDLLNDKYLFSSDSGTKGVCFKMECVPMFKEEFIENKWQHVLINVHVSSFHVEKVKCTPQEEGVKKLVPGMNGTLTCPNVSKACWNQPCANDGVPRNRMCNCQPGYIGKYCEIADTMKNRKLYPSHYHYRDLDDLTLIVGGTYEIPASIMGPVTKFYEITPLPKGLKVNSLTGAIEGTPTEPTAMFKCKTYTLGAMNEREKDKRGEAYESRTTIRIRVAENYAKSLQFINVNGLCPKMLFEFFPPKPITYEIEVEKSRTSTTTAPPTKSVSSMSFWERFKRIFYGENNDEYDESKEYTNERNNNEEREKRDKNGHSDKSDSSDALIGGKKDKYYTVIKRDYEFVYSDFSYLPAEMIGTAKQYMKNIYSSYLRIPSMAESRSIKYYSFKMMGRNINDWGSLNEKKDLSRFQFIKSTKRNVNSFMSLNIIDYLRNLDGDSDDYFSTEIEEAKTGGDSFFLSNSIFA